MVKINSLEIEGVKRIKAVSLAPSENGLTIIGGKNGQGKTSVLDAIAWALGGDRFRPTNAKRDGSYTDPYLKVTLSNGIIAERHGESSKLVVTDPTSKRGGQTLLNEFIGELSLNLPKFLESTSKEKAKILLGIIGIEQELTRLEAEENKLYNERYAIGRLRDQKDKFAKELPHIDGVPTSPISASDLIRRQQEILARNGENKRKRDRADELKKKQDDLEVQIAHLSAQLAQVKSDLYTAQQSAQDLEDISTAEIEKDIAEIDNINIRVRANLDRERAMEEAAEFSRKYIDLTDEIEAVRAGKLKLLEEADFPLPGLSVEQGELIYNGKAWDCMSASEQLKVGAAIVRKLKPECGFVLLDKLEQMDSDTLSEFGMWLESEGLQAIATRVSTGDECTIIIEDGMVAGTDESKEENTKTWTEGEF